MSSLELSPLLLHSDSAIGRKLRCQIADDVAYAFMVKRDRNSARGDVKSYTFSHAQRHAMIDFQAVSAHHHQCKRLKWCSVPVELQSAVKGFSIHGDILVKAVRNIIPEFSADADWRLLKFVRRPLAPLHGIDFAGASSIPFRVAAKLCAIVGSVGC